MNDGQWDGSVQTSAQPGAGTDGGEKTSGLSWQSASEAFGGGVQAGEREQDSVAPGQTIGQATAASGPRPYIGSTYQPTPVGQSISQATDAAGAASGPGSCGEAAQYGAATAEEPETIIYERSAASPSAPVFQTAGDPQPIAGDPLPGPGDPLPGPGDPALSGAQPGPAPPFNVQQTGLPAQESIRPGADSSQGYAAQPDGTAQPGYAAQPGGTAQPGFAAQPGGTAQPGYAAQPGGTAQPGFAAPPDGTAQPGFAAQPDGSVQPGFAAQPGGTVQPGYAAQPGAVSQPDAAGDEVLRSAPWPSNQTWDPVQHPIHGGQPSNGTPQQSYPITAAAGQGTASGAVIPAGHPSFSTYAAGVPVPTGMQTPSSEGAPIAFGTSPESKPAETVDAPSPSAEERKKTRPAKKRGGGTMAGVSLCACLALLASSIFYQLGSGHSASLNDFLSAGFIPNFLNDILFTLPIFLAALAKPWQQDTVRARIFILLPVVSCFYLLFTQVLNGISDYAFEPFTIESIWDVKLYTDYFQVMSDLSVFLLIGALVLLALRPGAGATGLTAFCCALDTIAACYSMLFFIPDTVIALREGYEDAMNQVKTSVSTVFYLLFVLCFYSALLQYGRFKKRMELQKKGA